MQEVLSFHRRKREAGIKEGSFFKSHPLQLEGPTSQPAPSPRTAISPTQTLQKQIDTRIEAQVPTNDDVPLRGNLVIVY